VEDLRLGLKLLAGPDDEDWDVPPVPVRDVPRRELRSYRFAWTDDFGGLPVSRETRAALETLATTLDRLGCRVERRGPPGVDYEELWEVWGRVLGSEMQALTRFVFSVRFNAMRGDTPLNRGIVRGVNSGMPEYIEALALHDRLTGEVEKFLSQWDAWLCPTSVSQAFPHLASGECIDVGGQKVPYLSATSAYTATFNLTGHPVVVLPVAKLVGSPLPLGIQVVGRRWLDEELLAVSEALTDVTGPFQKPPGY
jgi:amidase